MSTESANMCHVYIISTAGYVMCTYNDVIVGTHVEVDTAIILGLWPGMFTNCFDHSSLPLPVASEVYTNTGWASDITCSVRAKW